MTPEQFIERWERSGGAELANSQSFLKELCDLLEVPHPDPTESDSQTNRYVFEKKVAFNNGDGSFSQGRVDLYRAGCFVLESKQGSEREAAKQAEALATVTKTAKKLAGTAARGTAAWDRAMQAARVFFSSHVLPDNKLVAISLEEAAILGILSSRTHVTWALANGSRLGVGNDPVYVKTRCFETFPFPVADDAAKQRIGDLAEQLDAHRKRQQELHPALTMTGMYNVLEKLRACRSLTAKEQTIHRQGLVSVLKQIHDDLDAAVFDAYDWPHDLDDEEILQRLVDLNHERAEEERRGLIRWLRPEFQNPDGATQTAFADGAAKAKPTKQATIKLEKHPWPKTLPERMVAIQSALVRHAAPAMPAEVAAHYKGANRTLVTELLETLTAVGNVRRLTDGRFAVYK